MLSLFAQNKISVKITNCVYKESIRGATVTIKGTNIAIATDKSDNFTVQHAPPKSTLVTSNVGYQGTKNEGGYNIWSKGILELVPKYPNDGGDST